MCERSTDAGRSWPDEPQEISAPLAGAAPVRPVRDRRPRGRRHAGSQHVLRGLARHADWVPRPGTRGPQPDVVHARRPTAPARGSEPRIIQRIDQIPNVFPRQAFRNLSLPILAVGPRSELYMTWADYNPAPYAASDEDGFQADIHFSALARRRHSWSVPRSDQQGRRQRRPVPAVHPGDEVRPAQRVLLRPPLRPAGSARTTRATSSSTTSSPAPTTAG